MKIVVTNQVALNVGDAAILRGILVVLRRAFGDQIDVVVLDWYGAAPQRYYPDLTFRQAYKPNLGRPLFGAVLRKLDAFEFLPRIIARLAAGNLSARLLPRGLAENIEEYRSAQLVVSTGGTYLVEHYKIGPNLLQLSAAVDTSTPTIMFTQSVGRLNARRNRKWLRKIVRELPLVLLRDKRSLENLSEAGVVTTRARVVADAAFALANVSQLSALRSGNPKGRLRVAVSVREWIFPHHESAQDAARNYKATIGAMVRHLVTNQGAEVTFISTCQGVPEYRYDDSAVAAGIVATLPEAVRSRVSVDGAFHSPETLRDMLGSFDLIVATRMHMAILGLCAGTPVLPIAYEFKTRELFNALGMGEWVMDIETLDSEQAIDLLGKFIEALEQIRGRMIPRILEMRESALSVVSDLQQATSSGIDRLRSARSGA